MGKTSYREGDVFAVPLEDGGYGIGLVARATGGWVLGYFFDRIHVELPDLDALLLERDSAIAVERFGDDGLLNGTWPILGRIPAWNREAWPMPWFVNGYLDGQMFRQLTFFHPDDPRKYLGGRNVPPADAEGLPSTTFSPWRAQEIGLNRLLHRDPKPLPRVRIVPGPTQIPKAKAEPKSAPEEAVRVYFRLPEKGLTKKTEAQLEFFEDGLDSLLRMKKLGYVDGNETGQGEFVLYLYGRDRNAIWGEVQRMLKFAPIPAVSAYLRAADLAAEPTIIRFD